MSGIKCYFLQPTNRAKRFFRRFRSRSQEDLAQTCPHGYHDATVFLDEAPVIEDDKGCWRAESDPGAFPGDPRWPSACACGYRFGNEDEFQIFVDRIYWHTMVERPDLPEFMTLREATPGAIWDATWLHNHSGWCGPDGKSLICICPGGHQWHIDGRASNCTKPDDNVHKCWVRHGEPPHLTVDKSGNTCDAGGGSIQARNWHGYLRSGELVI